MRPRHPCPLCGHEFAEECRVVEAELPGRVRARCPHCRDECVPLLQVGPYPASPTRDLEHLPLLAS